MPDVTYARLTGSNRLEWAAVRAVLEDFTCAWVDQEGAHQVPAPPPAVPDCTHLWGWRGDVLARVRIDDGCGIVGMLDIGAVSETTGGPGRVPVRRGLATSWAESHVRVGDLEGASWDVVSVIDEISTVFVRRRPE